MLYTKEALIEVCDKLADAMLSFQEDARSLRATLREVLELAMRADKMSEEELREELRKLLEHLEVEL